MSILGTQLCTGDLEIIRTRVRPNQEFNDFIHIVMAAAMSRSQIHVTMPLACTYPFEGLAGSTG